MTKPAPTPAPSPTQLQGQAQGELQGQLQGQGQGQGQLQGQSMYQSSENESSNDNANCNTNGNENENSNTNSNELNNSVNNTVNDHVNTCVNTSVNVKVDLDLSGKLAQPTINDAINFDRIDNIHESLVMNDLVNQTVTNGNNFNIDQVSNLSQDNTLNSPTVTYNGGGASGACAYDCYGHPIPNTGGDFSMTATSTGGSASSTLGALTGDGGTFSGNGASNAAASITQEAFTQHIAMGANIQFNSLTLNNVGHDFADHASTI